MRDDTAWAAQHNEQLDEEQDLRQFKDDQMMKIVIFLKNKNMARRIENTPRQTLMRAFWKGSKYAKQFNQKPKKSRKRKAALEPELEPAVEDDFEQEIVVRKKIQMKIHLYQTN